MWRWKDLDISQSIWTSSVGTQCSKQGNSLTYRKWVSIMVTPWSTEPQDSLASSSQRARPPALTQLNQFHYPFNDTQALGHSGGTNCWADSQETLLPIHILALTHWGILARAFPSECQLPTPQNQESDCMCASLWVWSVLSQNFALLHLKTAIEDIFVSVIQLG